MTHTKELNHNEEHIISDYIDAYGRCPNCKSQLLDTTIDRPEMGYSFEVTECRECGGTFTRRL